MSIEHYPYPFLFRLLCQVQINDQTRQPLKLTGNVIHFNMNKGNGVKAAVSMVEGTTVERNACATTGKNLVNNDVNYDSKNNSFI